MKKRGKILSVKGHAELTDWIRRAVNAWGMDIGSEKLVPFSDHQNLKKWELMF